MTYTWEVKNGDYVLSSATGRPVRLRGGLKASQAMARILGIEAPLGAGLDTVIGTVPDSAEALSAELQTNIRAAFDRLVSVQTLNQIAQRTPRERLAYIARMFVQPAAVAAPNAAAGANQQSKTGYVFRVDVVTVAGQELGLQRVLIPPQGG